ALLEFAACCSPLPSQASEVFFAETGQYVVQGPINGTIDVVFFPQYLVAPIFADPGVTFETVIVSINGVSNYISAATALDFNYPGSTGGDAGGIDVFPITDQRRTLNVTVTDNFSTYPMDASATPGIVAAQIDLPDGLSIVAAPIPPTIWLIAIGL